MKKFMKKVICLWLSITLSGCGAAYQVDSIIRTDQNMAVTWKESRSKVCRGEGNPFNFCEENEYINPYTYNPEFADPISDPNSVTNSDPNSGSNSGTKKKNMLLAGKKSLYQLASASAVSLEISFGDINNPCGMAKTIVNRSNRLSDYFFKRYSSALKRATLNCENTDSKEVDRVARDLSAFLNAQLMSGNLYIEAGLGTDTMQIVTTSTVITEDIFNNPCQLAERITKRDNKLLSHFFSNYSTTRGNNTDHLRCSKTNALTVAGTLSQFLDKQLYCKEQSSDSAMTILQRMNRIAGLAYSKYPMSFDDVTERTSLGKCIIARDGGAFNYLFHSYSTVNGTVDNLRYSNDKQRAFSAQQVAQLMWQQISSARKSVVAPQANVVPQLILPEPLSRMATGVLRGEALWEINKNILTYVYKDYLVQYEPPRLARNKLQMAIMRVSDSNTSNHLANLKATQANVGMLFGLTTAGLTAGATVAARVTAQALSAAAGGTNAAGAIISDQVYRDVLVESLIGTIKVDCEKIRERIERNMGLSIAEYDVERAIYDAMVYHEACSFYSGLASMRELIEKGNASRKQPTSDRHEADALRDLENTKIPFIVFSYDKSGGTAYENSDSSSEWDISRTGGFDLAVG